MNTITTSVQYQICLRVGHVTFLSSAFASRTKFISEDIFVDFSAADFAIIFVFSSNKEMAGPAGLEPAAPGFGDQCSANWATDLREFLTRAEFYNRFNTLARLYFDSLWTVEALHHLQYFLSSSFFACFFLLTVVV